MLKSSKAWKRLANQARSFIAEHREQPATMPPGFDTRVLAHLGAPPGNLAELWLRLAWRLMPVGAAVFVIVWLALPPASADWPTPHSGELTELLIEEILPQ